MKLCLASNLLEHPGFGRFVEAARHALGDVGFLVAGDLLNVFPEPGEDLLGSIFHELYGGELLIEEMERLVRTRFAAPASSRFVGPLEDMFLPTGATYARARQIAARRYRSYFDALERALGPAPLFFIPGNMDWPELAFHAACGHAGLRSLDGEVVRIGAMTVGGLGGIPNTAHPFRGVVEISPYEMAEAEYTRRLRRLRGVDVLVTHLSPEEHPALDTLLRDSAVRLLVCRAPFDFRRQGDFRGRLEWEERHGKHVVKVRPFDFPANAALVLDCARPFEAGAVEVFRWTADEPTASGRS